MAGKGYKKVITLGADFTAFTGSATEAERKLKVLDSEFKKAAASAMELGQEEDLLGLKQETLNQKVLVQTKKVEDLKSSYKKLSDQYGENNKATEAALVKYNRAETALTKMKSELKSTSAEVEKHKSAMVKLGEQLEEVGEKYKKMGDKLQSAGRGMTASITAPILAIGAASVKMAADAEESENLFEVSMGKMAGSARVWSEQISDSLGVNEYNVRKTMGTFNLMFDSMGVGEARAYDMSKGLTQLSYDMASFYNLKPEEAFQKLQAGISGETEPLKRLGIVINDTSVKAYALKNGIAKAGQEMTDNQKVAARYGLIMEATAKAQGDLARTADSTSNKARSSIELLQEVLVKVGEQLKPIADGLLGIFKPLLTWLSNMDAKMLRVVIVVAGLVAAIGPMLIIVGKVASSISSISSLLTSFNPAAIRTTLIVLGVVAALIALVAVIAALSGKTNEVERTFSAIGSGVGQVTSKVQQQQVPRYATGTQYHPGGPAIINEEGPETVVLPRGTKVIPAGQSAATGGNIYVTVQADTIQKAADFMRIVESAQREKRSGLVPTWG